jgi:hypothetical protein
MLTVRAADDITRRDQRPHIRHLHAGMQRTDAVRRPAGHRLRASARSHLSGSNRRIP